MCQHIHQHWTPLITDAVDQRQQQNDSGAERHWLFSTSGHFVKSMPRLRGQWEPCSSSVIPPCGGAGGGRKKRRQLTISLLVRDYCAFKGVWGEMVCLFFCSSWALRNQTQGCVFWPRIEFYSRIISPWLLHWPVSVWGSSTLFTRIKELGESGGGRRAFSS